MKKYLLVITSIVFFISGVYCQTSIYHPMPSATAFWGEFLESSSGNQEIQFAIFGDTLIGTDAYHKLYRRTSTCRDTLMTPANSQLIGGLREDNTKKVHFYSIASAGSGSSCTSNTLNKIYDFSKQTPGDTIQFKTSTSDYCHIYKVLTLKSVDSILIDKTYRKYYHYDNNENWIEGIGSTRSLLSTLIPLPACACVQTVVCFRQPNKLIYMNPVYNQCFCFTTVGISNSETAINIALLPNPFSSETALKINGSLTNADLYIYDAFGRQVKEMKNRSGESIMISRNGLVSGLYYVCIIQDNKLLANTRLMIIDN
jgi:hypothetical protein